MTSPAAIHLSKEHYDDQDGALIFSLVIICLLGLLMVYSASVSISAAKTQGQSIHFFFYRQAFFLVMAVISATLVAMIPMLTWQRLAPWLFIIGVIVLALVLIPGIGHSINGARRWFYVHGVGLQPSEYVKCFVIVYTADYAVRKAARIHRFRAGFLPMAVVMLLVGFLLINEPDFGAFVVIVSIAFGILFLAGLDLGVLIILMIAVSLAFAAIVYFSHYRRERLMYFLNPWSDELGKGYQLVHSLIAFGRGGILGSGLGASVEKLFYLPEAYSDFLLAVIGEELGLWGVLAVFCLLGFVIHKALCIGRTALRLGQDFSGLVAQGIGIWFAVQSMISCGVSLGLLPTKGLTIPLMSYGGSSLLANGFAVGLLLRVDWENRKRTR